MIQQIPVSNRQRLCHLRSCPFAYAHIEHLALTDQIIECTQCFLNGCLRIIAVAIHNVHIFYPQPLQAGMALLRNMFT
ncbi:hypothetical protein D3C73_1603030 [compost metagenome]